jgi:hypothetical protein
MIPCTCFSKYNHNYLKINLYVFYQQTLFNECSTVEGLEAYYKRNSIPKFLEGKKEDIAAANAKNYEILKSMPKNIIDDLTRFLDHKMNDNW